MECLIYDTNHVDLLERYFQHDQTPINNRNHKIFKTSLYDGKTGIMLLLVDGGEIVATFGAIIIQLDGATKAIKMPHRLHVRRDYTDHHFEFIDRYFEPMIYDWLQDKGVHNLMLTVNEGNERVLYLAGRRHPRRRIYALDYLCDLGQSFVRQTWSLQPFLIEEQHTWQYLFWVSLDGKAWDLSWRPTRPISAEVESTLQEKFQIRDGVFAI